MCLFKAKHEVTLCEHKKIKNNLLPKIRKTPYPKDFISTNELNYTEKVYNNQRKIITSSKFSQLKKLLGIFYDKENILRVEKWFSNADVDYKVTELVVWSVHKRVFHGDVNNTFK